MLGLLAARFWLSFELLLGCLQQGFELVAGLAEVRGLLPHDKGRTFATRRACFFWGGPLGVRIPLDR